MNHVNLLKLECFYETHECYYLVFNHCKGCLLSDYISKNGPLDPHQCAIILEVLLDIIKHLNENGVIHRDITPSNILIKSNEIKKENIFLIGFEKSTTKKLSFNLSSIGSPGFIAPEIFKTRSLDLIKLGKSASNFTFKCDYFSLGVTLYFMLFGKLPYEDEREAIVLKKNKLCKFKFVENSKFAYFKNDILPFLEKNPQKRRCLKEKKEITDFLVKFITFETENEVEEVNANLLRNNLDKLKKYSSYLKKKKTKKIF